MLRYIWILLFFTLFVESKRIDVAYSVEFGIVGEVAKVNASLELTPTTYELNAHVKAEGHIANMVTHNLREHHISRGSIENGLLITRKYLMIKDFGLYHTITTYTVNHKRKRILKHYVEYKKGKKVYESRNHLGYYAKDDMLTLFLNLPLHIEQKYKTKHYQFSVVGADRKNGRVDIEIPSLLQKKEMKSLLGKCHKDEWFTKVVMHRKLYHSKNGELAVKIGKEGFVDLAVLKDLIFFGDVRIIRIN